MNTKEKDAKSGAEDALRKLKQLGSGFLTDKDRLRIERSNNTQKK